MSAKTLKPIVVDDVNYQRLKRLGYASESFNDVITRILDEKENEAGTAARLNQPESEVIVNENIHHPS